jgi:SRSO17 transposase
VRGLLAPVERKNGWQLAEMTGQSTPYKIQQFLYRGRWDTDELRDQLQRYVKDHLGSPEGVLVVDETGFLKKGTHSAGVQRQYSGTAGRIENCQIGVFLSYATPQGYTFVDRQLYLPESWTNDPQRCRAAGVPQNIRFQTKPEMGLSLIQRAIANGIGVRWVTGDSIYGDYRTIRLWLEEQKIGYVMGVSGKEYVWQGYAQHRVSTLLATLPTDGWARLSAGEGSKGPRLYEWLRLPVNAPPLVGWERHLLVRRSLSDPTALSAYACCAPVGTLLATLVQVAGTRWTIEAAFESAKGEVGLDHYEVRSWQGWYRHITLACFAHAFLTVLRAHLNTAEPLSKNSPLCRQMPTAFLPFKARRRQPSL